MSNNTLTYSKQLDLPKVLAALFMDVMGSLMPGVLNENPSNDASIQKVRDAINVDMADVIRLYDRLCKDKKIHVSMETVEHHRKNRRITVVATVELNGNPVFSQTFVATYKEVVGWQQHKDAQGNVRSEGECVAYEFEDLEVIPRF